MNKHMIRVAITWCCIFFIRTVPAHAQNMNACDTLVIAELNAAVLLDHQEQRFGYFTVPQTGYYRVQAFTRYNSGDHQRNETYYLEFENQAGDPVQPLDANAGPHKIVRDAPGVLGTIWRDTGLFFFRRGGHTSIMRHMVTLEDIYPEFKDGDYVGKESVHILELKLVPADFDLAVSATPGNMVHAVAPDTVAIGSPVHFEISVKNQGPEPAWAPRIQATLPKLATLESASVQPHSIRGDTLFWQLTSLLPGDSANIELHLSTPTQLPHAPFSFTLEAATAARCETRLSNNTDAATIFGINPPPSPDLTAGLTASVDSVDAGEAFTYELRATNSDTHSAEHIEIVAILADSLTFIESVPDPSRKSADSLFWQRETLNPNDSFSISIDAFLSPNMPEGTHQLISRAHVAAQNEPLSKRGNNNAADTLTGFIDKTRVNAFADLLLTQDVSAPSFLVRGGDTLMTAGAGEDIFYTIHVTNHGDRYAADIQIVDWLPDYVTVSAGTPEFSINASDSIVWYLPALAPGQSKPLRFTATLSAQVPTGENLLINSAMGSAANEPDSLQADNFTSSTVHNFVSDLIVPPQISAMPARIEVGDSIFVRVTTAVENKSWDLRVYRADGHIDSSFADAFIASTSLQPDVWIPVYPTYQQTRFVSSGKQEEIIFELRTVDIFNHRASARATVQLQSANNLVLARNVFRPELESALDINFKLDSNRSARLDLYDIAGTHVTMLTEGPFQAGWNSHTWNSTTTTGQQVGSGVYVITIRSGEYAAFKKVIITR